jgi:hypothetical protein
VLTSLSSLLHVCKTRGMSVKGGPLKPPDLGSSPTSDHSFIHSLTYSFNKNIGHWASVSYVPITGGWCLLFLEIRRQNEAPGASRCSVDFAQASASSMDSELLLGPGGGSYFFSLPLGTSDTELLFMPVLQCAHVCTHTHTHTTHTLSCIVRCGLA